MMRPSRAAGLGLRTRQHGRCVRSVLLTHVSVCRLYVCCPCLNPIGGGLTTLTLARTPTGVHGMRSHLRDSTLQNTTITIYLILRSRRKRKGRKWRRWRWRGCGWRGRRGGG